MTLQLPEIDRIRLGGSAIFPPSPHRANITLGQLQRQQVVSAEYVYPSEFSPNLIVRVKLELDDVVSLARPVAPRPKICVKPEDIRDVPPTPEVPEPTELFYFGSDIAEQLSAKPIWGSIYIRECAAVLIQTDWYTDAKQVASQNFPLPSQSFSLPQPMMQRSHVGCMPCGCG